VHQKSRIRPINPGEIEANSPATELFLGNVNRVLETRSKVTGVMPQNAANTLRSEIIEHVAGAIRRLDDTELLKSESRILEEIVSLISQLSQSDLENIREIQTALNSYPLLSEIVIKLYKDTERRLDLVEYLKDPQTRQTVLEELRLLASIAPLTPKTFQTRMREPLDPEKIGSLEHDRRFNESNDGESRMIVLRRILLDTNPELYSVSDKVNVRQEITLDSHVERLEGEIKPDLDRILRQIGGLTDETGFPHISVRVKSSDGILDKIRRMREGNPEANKAPRPEYQLADMPDVVGGRITVSNTDELSQVMIALETHFGAENIFQKENFYINERKRERPYRVVTYTIEMTVQIQGVPCEIQITTLRSSIVADIEHNTVYKNYHPELTEEARTRAKQIEMAAAISEHDSLQKR